MGRYGKAPKAEQVERPFTFLLRRLCPDLVLKTNNIKMEKKIPPVDLAMRRGFWAKMGDRLFGRRQQFDCLQVEVSSRCLGRCSYCPHTILSTRWQGRDMDMDTFGRLWPLMCRSVRVHLQGWGEPFLNPNFFAMADLARTAGCKVSTTTCGLGMDRDRAEKVVASGMDIVAFSLVGTDAASNAPRHGVDFERVYQGIATLRETRQQRKVEHPEIHIAYLLLASNTEAVAGLPGLMQRLGVSQAVVSTLDYLPEPGLQNEAFSSQDKVKIDKTAALLDATATEAWRLGLGFHYQFPAPESSANGCSENIGRSLVISADGSVAPCVFLNVSTATAGIDSRIFGNVHLKAPLAIWESAEYRHFRDRLSQGDPDVPCLSCRKRFHPDGE
jgi:sulfatase maturation enzyme AslB (radical SAM superfamily)